MAKKSDKEKKKERKNIGTVKNNLFAVRLLWEICPSLVVHKAILSVLDYGEWLFYSAFFMRYVINALQEGKAFSTLMIFIGITVAVFASINSRL